MSDRMEIIQWGHTPSGKAFAKRIGTATPKQNGEGYKCFLDVLPAPELSRDKDRIQITFDIVPPRDKPAAPDIGNQHADNSGDLNDEVPF